MAYQISLARAGTVRSSSTILKAVAALSLSVCAYGFAIPETGGSHPVDIESDLPFAPQATLGFEDEMPVITGTVASLFHSSTFSGPNRTAKSDRAKPEVNLVAFAQTFDAVRLSIASARSFDDPAVALPSSVRVADSAEDGGARVTVAAINPSAIGADGLRAIGELADGNTADPSLVARTSVPDALAYGRANTPATDFTPQHAWSEREQWCLSTGIYFEARGESYRGQVAVAQVIMNRVEDHRYPDTICGVVYQNQHRRNACQFSFACDGIADRITEPAAWALAQEITQTVLNKEIYLTEVADATHYHATYVRPHWARNMDKLSQVGLHVFYRFKPGWLFG